MRRIHKTRSAPAVSPAAGADAQLGLPPKANVKGKGGGARARTSLEHGVTGVDGARHPLATGGLLPMRATEHGARCPGQAAKLRARRVAGLVHGDRTDSF